MLPALAALLVFVASSSLAALAMVLPTHRGLDGLLAVASLSLGTVAGAGAFWHVRRREGTGQATRRRQVSPWGWAVGTAFALFALRSFCWLVYSDGKQLAIGSQDNLGDISLHMQLAQLFANGAAWWPAHPEAAGFSLRYYPGVELFQSLWLLVGADPLHVLVWMGLVGSAAAALALFRWGGSFTVAGFLFSGGLAGFQFFRAFQIADYQHALAWKSLPLTIFVTQRPFLFALPAGLLLLIHWRAKFFSDPPLAPRVATANAPAAGPPPLPTGPGVLPFWVEALLYAAMPVFHLFAFVFLSLLLGWWFVVYFGRAGQRWHWLKLVGAALAPATILLALMTGNGSAARGGVVHLQWNWMNHDALNPVRHQSFVSFWLLNFGLFALLAPALWCRCAWDLGRATLADLPRVGYSRDEDADTAFVLPAGIIFVLASVVMFASWDWDNTKLMIWSYLAFLPFLWRRWVHPLAAPIRWPVCALLFFSGAVSLAGGLGQRHIGYGLIERSELNGVMVATDALPVSGRFAAAPDYNHPLVYCGRLMALGYEGHLASQSIDYKPLADTLDALMLGELDWTQAAGTLGVRYLFWGPREEKKWPASTKPWERQGPPLAQGDWGKIYDLGAAAGK